MMTIQKLLETGNIELSGLDEGILEARRLLEYILNCDYNYILIHKDEEIEDEQCNQYIEYLKQRKTKKPVSQIMGLHSFYDLVLKVSGDTLIPRQETEILVEFVLKSIGNQEILICDIGTGTGAIPIAICHEQDCVKAIAIDVSKEALEIARYNVSMYELEDRIKCIESDLFSGLDNCYENTIDILISNPPYIPTKLIDTLDEQVKDFEPRLALDGGEDGLDYYRYISKEARMYLANDSMIVYEVGHDQSQAVCKILDDCGYEDIDVVQDLAGINRIVYAVMRKPKEV